MLKCEFCTNVVQFKQDWHKPPFYAGLRRTRKVRFRSAALSKNKRTVEITAFLLFFIIRSKVWRIEHLPITERLDHIRNMNGIRRLVENSGSWRIYLNGET